MGAASPGPSARARSGRTTIAAALLDPLTRHDTAGRGSLVDSLRAWLEQHGPWDPAAVKLGVHRHTLRHRMGKVEQLLGRSLDSPTLHAELWLALQTLPRAPVADESGSSNLHAL